MGDLEVSRAFGVRIVADQYEVNIVHPVPIDRIAADVLNGAIVARNRRGELRSATIAEVYAHALAAGETPAAEADDRSGRSQVRRQLRRRLQLERLVPQRH